MPSRLTAIGAAVLLLIAIVGGTFWFVQTQEPDQTARGEALVGGPFTLTDHNGQRVSEQDFAGRFMLIYFGYTFCPDFCPMSLSTMASALDLLPDEQAEQVVPILISIDPERDTVEQLAQYAPLFHPRLVALTGTLEEIKQAASAYRVYFAKADAEADDGDYLMDHSTFIYLIGPDGQYRTHFSHSASAEEMAEGVREELDQS